MAGHVHFESGFFVCFFSEINRFELSYGWGFTLIFLNFSEFLCVFFCLNIEKLDMRKQNKTLTLSIKRYRTKTETDSSGLNMKLERRFFDKFLKIILNF